MRLGQLKNIKRLELVLYFKSFFNKWSHELQTPNEAFFHWIPKLLGLDRQFGQINFGAFGVFLANLSAAILVEWVPCPCFPLFNYYLYKKLSLYIQIPNIYLGLGFEFGPQRIRDLAFMSILQYIEYASTILNNLFFSFKRSNQML